MGEEAHPATTGQPLDLDSIEDAARIASHYTGTSRAVVMKPEETLRLVAELRAAREDNQRLRRGHEMHEANHLRIVESLQAELRAAREDNDKLRDALERLRVADTTIGRIRPGPFAPKCNCHGCIRVRDALAAYDHTTGGE